MLRVCICDDNAGDAAKIQTLADRFAGEHPEFTLKIQTFFSAFDLLEQLDEDGGFDLYLLDILMPHLKGLDLAERIRARNENSEIIFLTSSPEYALDAFEVSACGYLLKPVKKEKFDKVFQTAICRLTQPENSCLLLKGRDGMRKILIRELVMIESFNHDRVCSMADGSQLITSDTLAFLMEHLSSAPCFFSPHRAYIVNLEHITALNAADLLLSTGQRVPVARTKYAALKKAYMDFLFFKPKAL